MTESALQSVCVGIYILLIVVAFSVTVTLLLYACFATQTAFEEWWDNAVQG